MPLDDPRLTCPACGRLVEVDAERFEDLFEDPDDAVDAGPTFHAECIRGPGMRAWLDRTRPSGTVQMYEAPDIGPLTSDDAGDA